MQMHMCDPFWGTTVPAYSRSYNGISFDETTLKEIGIDDPGKIEKLEFTLIVHDNNDWAADPILKQICTYERS